MKRLLLMVAVVVLASGAWAGVVTVPGELPVTDATMAGVTYYSTLAGGAILPDGVGTISRSLSWLRSPEADVSHYNIYIGGGYCTRVDQPTSETLRLEEVIPVPINQQAVTVEVSAVDMTGNESARVPVVADTLPPDPPKGVTLISVMVRQGQ